MLLKSRFEKLHKYFHRDRPRYVVYTSLFGHSENFLDVEYKRQENIDFVCFTDDEDLHSDFWQIKLVPKSLLDPHRRSKGFKHRPHLFFPTYDSSLYIDNTVRLLMQPEDIFAIAEEINAPMMLFRHPERSCIYDEAQIVTKPNFDDKSLIEMQMDYYKYIGYPMGNGLHATGVIFRKHGKNNLNVAMDEWHSQVLRYSKRDQLSFDVIRHFYNLNVATFDGSLTSNKIMEWPIIHGGVRLPRDFDDRRYLELHPDVAAAGINPRKHYLKYGISEGRSYRMER